MRGAIAAGHPRTAQAGADVLAEGGNAVDACIAATAVSWVVESPLTGPGGGGFMIVHRAADSSTRVLDAFVATPGAGLSEPPAGAMAAAEITFSPGNAVPYGVGGASVGVPGTIAGLAEAHRSYGSRPWGELLRPAARVAREGVVLTPEQARLHHVLDPVLRLTPEARKIYGADRPLEAGETLALGDLAETLEALAEEGAETFYRGELGRRTVAHVEEEGGCLTRADLESYRVIRRTPVRATYRGHELVSNPPPSSGGVLVAFALRVLDHLGDEPAAGSGDAIARFAEVMREATRARSGAFASALYRGGLATRLLADDRVGEAVTRVREILHGAVAEPAALPSTTHVSVVDARGNAASHSASTGCGAGLVVPGTGIHLNNMLGEIDLNPDGRMAGPGRRLTSMMAPSIVLRDGRPRLVLGSAGSARLRGAIVQIVVNALAHGMALSAAIARPRAHLDGHALHVEPGLGEAVEEDLTRRGYNVVRWPTPNVYFGGASVVALQDDGRLDAAGDPRRGGAGVVVA
jgi:gamma-glutamyltranspeptidase / glutathione hydrolase